MENFFQERSGSFSEIEIEYRTKGKRISNIRWVIFVLFLVVAVYLFSDRQYSYTLLLFSIFIAVYIPLVIWHKKVNTTAAYNKILHQINEEELLRISGKIESLNPGSSFYDVGHPYSKDLDIFGNYSLFQYLNRCSTEPGMQLLADWLKNSAVKKEIQERQAAVKELTPLIDFRQNLQADGRLLTINKNQVSQFQSWIQSVSESFKNSWFLPLLVFLNLLTLITFAYCIFNGGWKLILIPLAINFIFLNIFSVPVKTIKTSTENISKSLKALSRILLLIEQQNFNSARLLLLKKPLEGNGTTSSSKIKKIAYLFEMLEYTTNPYFYLLVNSTFLWDLHWARKIEIYKREINNDPENWLSTLYQFEALSSIAGLSFLHKDWVFPVISDHAFIYKAEELKHPLIFSGKAVSNTFSLEGISKTIIITGSNMSGKSTFLRTLGINAILAFSGAPVCAKSFEISVFNVFSSMRTEDNLQESTSSFYAELKRLKQLLDYLSPEIPVFYLLDEILKGTNSSDRNTGGKALVRQLQGKNASGLIATHDIELSNLQNEASENISNFSFSSDIVDGKLYFDYKIKNGVCRSFNATELMRQIGIEVELGRD